MAETSLTSINRRTLLIGGGTAVGLAVAWSVWPRSYALNLSVGPGETLFNAFLKIATDGRVIVAVPQAEMGQGVYSALPQILADELGADWQTISVEPAPIHPLYGNTLLLDDAVDGLPGFLHGIGHWAAARVAQGKSLQVTGGSTSVRMFEQPLREAGAAARSLLCKAAARRWSVDWTACDTADGFVTRGLEKIRFGDLAGEAAGFAIPEPLTFRVPGAGRLSGQSLPRLDVPSKVDGSARFGADVRLPGMLYASVRAAPAGGAVEAVDKKVLDGLPGLVRIVRNPGWVAVVARDWWSAERAVDRLIPSVTAGGSRPDSAAIEKRLRAALAAGGKSYASQGDVAGALSDGGTLTAEFAVPAVAHAALEPMTATARVTDTEVELWVPTQSITLQRDAVAAALGRSPAEVIVYQTLVGGGFGRKIEVAVGVQAALIAAAAKQPVQLIWSRAEDSLHDMPRPPARARLRGRVGADKRIAAWEARIAAPASEGELLTRLTGYGDGGVRPEAAAVAGALPPYAIPAFDIAHAYADIGVPTGMWRSVANSYTAFFTECFVDELASQAGVDPLTFRLRMLETAPRHAKALTLVTARGGWQGGGPETGQGIALHECFGSIVAMMAEARVEDGKLEMDRIVAAVDCGRMINPDIVKQQVEGGILWGLAAARDGALSYAAGQIQQRNFDGFNLPLIGDTPQIEVILIQSKENPGGVGEIAVPPVAPAIANALFTLTGTRLRSLPFAGQLG